MNDPARIRAYLRSWPARILSYLCAGSVVFWIVYPQYGMWPLYVGCAASIIMALPLIRSERWNQKLDMKTAADRSFVIWIAVYVAAILIFATWYAGKAR
jgi:hypothetical protein